jgi:3-hydroxyisobutyrate dehydrogenase-like beta-hydroxyacid dehydrogenase
VLIGFAGLGRMGLPMARNLAAAGYPVLGHDPATPSAPTGIELVDDPAALAAADLTISMLPDAATTRALVLDGLAATPPDHLHVVMGTVGPDLIPELAGLAAFPVVDAPVSGSTAMAETAAITTMVGSTPEQFERLRPVLAAMTSAQFHTGPAGSGSTAKLAVNTVLTVLNEAVAEGLLVAEAGGLDPKTFYEVLRSSAAGAPYVDYKEDAFLDPAMADVAAPISLIRKDIGLALELATGCGIDLPGAEAAQRVLDLAARQGLADHDMAEVLTALRRADSPARERAAAEVVQELEDRRYAAVVAGNFAEFERLAHPDLAYTHSNGDVDDLASYREKCESGYYVYHRVEHSVDRIVVAGDTALVIGEMHADLTAGGTRKTLANRALAVWVRGDDGWRLIAFQPTVRTGPGR